MPPRASTMVSLGTPAPAFALPDTQGQTVRNTDFAGKPMLVAFICNHCPYVLHIADHFAARAADYQSRGLAVVAINANDPEQSADDAPDQMPAFVRDHNFTFPYLYDASQEVAAAYEATCTPDLFLYDANHTLVYRGQYDGSRPNRETPVSGADLDAAVDALLRGASVPEDQSPSVGCSIKWRPGNEPVLKPMS